MKKLKVLPGMRCDDGCGDCCGLIPCTETEFKRIEKHIKEHKIEPVEYASGTCPLYQNGKCSVYSIRPLICKLFGHSEDALMQCSRGYNVNIPEREVHRMLTANGMCTRTLHDLIPGFEQKAHEHGLKERARGLISIDAPESVEEQLRHLAKVARGQP